MQNVSVNLYLTRRYQKSLIYYHGTHAQHKRNSKRTRKNVTVTYLSATVPLVSCFTGLRIGNVNSFTKQLSFRDIIFIYTSTVLFIPLYLLATSSITRLFYSHYSISTYSIDKTKTLRFISSCFCHVIKLPFC